MASAPRPHQHVQRVSRELLAVARSSTATHEHLRNRLLAIIWVTVLVDIVSTFIVLVTEHHAHGSEIHNLFDAFLFSTSQLLTASSVASPATNAGKVIELFFDIYAITVVATLAGSFGAFFHRRGEEHDAAARAKAVAAASR